MTSVATTGGDQFTARGLDDRESRYYLSTQTPNNGHWDQVVGVSQGIINANFQRLFELNPDMGSMYSSVDDVGRIDATLLAPRVLVPGQGNSRITELIYQLRFEKGSMYDRDGKALLNDLTGWVISVPILLDIKSEKLDPKTSPTDIMIANNKKQHEFIKKQFNVPGDYSIERLYAKLSSARWNDFTAEHSVAGLNPDGTPIPLQNWMLSNSALWMHLRIWLGFWANQQDQKGKNLIGVSFQVPPVQNAIKATYEPTDMMHQAYPYMSIPQKAPDGAEGFEGAGTRNALLYCEMIKGHRRPDKYPLGWSGNFTTQATTPESKDQIDGTFLLGKYVFMEEFLLPQLQRLNQASEIFFDKPVAEMRGNEVWCTTPYRIGFDPSASQSTNEKYKFVSLNPFDKHGVETGYRFEKPPKTEEIMYTNPTRNLPSLKASVETSATVDVKWKLGTSDLTISGRSFVKENLLWDQGLVPPDFSKLWAWLRDEYTVTWSMELRVTTKAPPAAVEKKVEEKADPTVVAEQPKPDAQGKAQNGVLDIVIVTPPKIDVKWHKDQLHIEQDGKGDEIEKAITNQFSKSLPVLIANVKEQLAGAGRFVFPGNGVFEFKDPRFTKWGDLVAQIDYKPLKRDSLRIVPRGAKIVAPPPPDTTELRPSIQYDPGEFRLTWECTAAAEGERAGPTPLAMEPMKLVIRGTNEKTEALHFKEIRIIFTACKLAKAMFYESSFEVRKDRPVDDKPKSADPSKPKTAEVAPVGGTESATLKDLPDPGNSVISGDNAEETSGSQLHPTSKSIGTQDGVAEDMNSTSEQTKPIGQDLVEAGKQIYKAIITYVSGEEKDETPKGGTVSFSQSTAKKDAIVRFGPIAPAGGLERWQITIDGSSGTLGLAPNEWVELTLKGKANGPFTYYYTIDEDWTEVNEHYMYEFYVDVESG